MGSECPRVMEELSGDGDCVKVNGVGFGLSEKKGLGVEVTTFCAVVCLRLTGVEGPKFCDIDW